MDTYYILSGAWRANLLHSSTAFIFYQCCNICNGFLLVLVVTNVSATTHFAKGDFIFGTVDNAFMYLGCSMLLSTALMQVLVRTTPDTRSHKCAWILLQIMGVAVIFTQLYIAIMFLVMDMQLSRAIVPFIIYLIQFALHMVSFIVVVILTMPPRYTRDVERANDEGVVASTTSGATEEQIANINTRVLRLSSTSSTSSLRSSSGEDVCSICLGAFHERQRVSSLPCCHRFHTNCVNRWLQQSNTCPLCKRIPIAFDTMKE